MSKGQKLRRQLQLQMAKKEQAARAAKSKEEKEPEEVKELEKFSTKKITSTDCNPKEEESPESPAQPEISFQSPRNQQLKTTPKRPSEVAAKDSPSSPIRYYYENGGYWFFDEETGGFIYENQSEIGWQRCHSSDTNVYSEQQYTDSDSEEDLSQIELSTAREKRISEAIQIPITSMETDETSLCDSMLATSVNPPSLRAANEGSICLAAALNSPEMVNIQNISHRFLKKVLSSPWVKDYNFYTLIDDSISCVGEEYHLFQKVISTACYWK